MTSQQPTTRGAVAGTVIVACILVGAAIGLGLGEAVDFPALPAVVGGFAGLITGLVLVFRRFRDL